MGESNQNPFAVNYAVMGSMQAWAALTGTVGAQNDIEETRVVQPDSCTSIHRAEEMLLLPLLSPWLQEHVGGQGVLVSIKHSVLMSPVPAVVVSWQQSNSGAGLAHS